MARDHRDENTRITGERHAGVVIKDGKLLLVHRIKNGYEYYVFPGGHRQTGETGEQTVIREVFEETDINISNPRLGIKFPDLVEPNINYYYLCDWVSGNKPKLTGEESEADPKVDFYDPTWIDLGKIEELNILPEFAKSWLIEYLKKPKN
jgi:8-oxo-dGTP pyrophosphatase MutT (NUDIX family)